VALSTRPSLLFFSPPAPILFHQSIRGAAKPPPFSIGFLWPSQPFFCSWESHPSLSFRQSRRSSLITFFFCFSSPKYNFLISSQGQTAFSRSARLFSPSGGSYDHAPPSSRRDLSAAPNKNFHLFSEPEVLLLSDPLPMGAPPSPPWKL